MGKGIRVLLVDDHELARQGLRRMLELEGDLEVVGEASNGEEALSKVAALNPQVVLMDIKMPSLNGLETSLRLTKSGWRGGIIILSVYEEYLTEALEAGVSGYLVKDVKRSELVAAIRRVARGEVVVGGNLLTNPRLAEGLLKRFQELVEKKEVPFGLEISASTLPLEEALTQVHQEPPVPAQPAGLETRPQSLSTEMKAAGDMAASSQKVDSLSPVEGEGLVAAPPEASPSPSPIERQGSQIELVLPPPVEAPLLLEFCYQLRRSLGVEIVETIGSWKEGTRMRLLLRKPIPLVEMLTAMPQVAEVTMLPVMDKKANRTEAPSFRLTLKGRRDPKQLALKI